MSSKSARVIYWFRTDLRLHDSPALKAALDLKPECLWPIWTWDPHYVYRAKVGTNRWQFLLDCQNDLSDSITRLNKKSKLFVLREAPQTLFPKLFKAWKVTHLVFEKDTDAYARERDEVVMKLAKEAGVKVISPYGRTLWDSDDIVAKHSGKPTMSISQLQATGQKIGPIPKPITAPTSLPNPGPTPIDFSHNEPETNPDLNAAWRNLKDKGYTALAGPKNDFAPATLAEMGFEPATGPHKGGETTALKMLDDVTSNVEYAATFRKPQTSPAAFEPQSTTLLSPFLHFGALSVRLFYHRAQEATDAYNKNKKGGSSQPPESLTGQLLFRDMYFAAQAALGHKMTQTVGNSVVRFVPWHLPSKYTSAEGKPKAIPGAYEIDSPQADEWFQRWKHGYTGFPWIDALMRQLRHDGWIHHLGRHSVACFLTRGGCYIDWERGAEVFEELLIDHEPACNSGNWQWLSCTAFFSQYYRCYSPIAFGQKWDKKGDFVRRWVPELKDLNAKFIYEPWKAPFVDQKKAGVRVMAFPGVDKMQEMEEGTYPKPMFNFGERRNICISSLKKAYAVGLYGNDEKALDGSWREVFANAGDGDDNTEGQGHIDGSDDDGGNVDNADDDKEEDKTEKKGTGRGAPSKRTAKQGTLDGHVKRQKA